MVNDISKSIAKFLIEQGNPVASEKNMYSINVKLGDTRTVVAAYTDYSGKGVENPSKLSKTPQLNPR